jgi:aminoglycoside 3-N-acetyltransferase
MVRAYLRSFHNGVRRSVGRARRRWSAPHVNHAQSMAALSRLPAPVPGLLCVHSSLSACGYVAGGAATVIGALRQWNAGGTLAMPAHSYCYPSGDRPAPAFNPTLTPSVVGTVTDAFWRRPGVRRSLHPTHSIAAEGPEAERLVAGHEDCDTPCGRGTPYERLVESDAAILMFGATLEAYTLFHTAEDAAQVPYLYEPQRVALCYRDQSGRRHAMLMWKHDMTVPRSFREKDQWLEQLGLLHRVALGSGELLLIPHARQAHHAIVAELRRTASFLTAA